MDNILLNQLTKASTDAFLSSPSHGLIIIGPNGSGKSHLAKYIASKVLDLELNKLETYPYFTVVRPSPDKNQISIGQIREIKLSINLKTPSNAPINKVILIEQAEVMSHEAQNALLKLLEEPNEGTALILTSAENSNLLPTINSRLQSIVIHPISLEKSKAYFKTFDKEINRAWHLSLGYAGLMYGLLNDKLDHELNIGLSDAREVLSVDSYHRLLIIPQYLSDKPRLTSMLTAMSRILSASHFNAINKGDNNQIIQILNTRKALALVQSSLSQNGNTRLNLLYLFTSIG